MNMTNTNIANSTLKYIIYIQIIKIITIIFNVPLENSPTFNGKKSLFIIMHSRANDRTAECAKPSSKSLIKFLTCWIYIIYIKNNRRVHYKD